MLFSRIRKFREKTMERYQQDLLQEMEPWKKKVLRMHEDSEFLFYFDEFLDWASEKETGTIKGNLVKGNLKPGSVIYLYTGDAVLLTKATVLSAPEEKEDKRIGMLREKKNTFTIQPLPILKDAKKAERKFQILQMELSLLSNLSPDQIQE